MSTSSSTYTSHLMYTVQDLPSCSSIWAAAVLAALDETRVSASMGGAFVTTGIRHSRSGLLMTLPSSEALGGGYLFITADYRLLHPFTGLDQFKDVLRLFHFLGHDFNGKLGQGVTMTLGVDSKITVIGESGGGYIARPAALHAVLPRPAALVSYYCMGGDILSDFWLSVREPQPSHKPRESHPS